MALIEWLLDQKLSDWVQGLGSLAAAGAAVGIALRQERADRMRSEAARVLRRQVLAAAIVPVLRDLQATARVRSGVLQTLSHYAVDDEPPSLDELMVPLPEIFMSTIERIDVFGAYLASQVYTLVHRVNDYNGSVESQRAWDVPYRTWGVNLRPKIDGIGQTLDILIPRLAREVDQLEDSKE